MSKVITNKQIRELPVSVKKPYIKKHYYKLRSAGASIVDTYTEIQSYFKTSSLEKRIER